MLTREEHDELFGDVYRVEPFFKAPEPYTDGDARYCYIRPHEEVWDADEEKTLMSALAATAEHYLRFGNVDLNHITLFGFKLGIANPHLWEIGQPNEVIIDGTRWVIDRSQPRPRVTVNSRSDFKDKCLVKAEIYRGDGESCAKANFWWDTMYRQRPQQTWYPSVGGTKPRKQDLKNGRKVVLGVLWTNIGLAKEPVNRVVEPVTLLAPAEFAKAVMAGYGTDSATLTGGAALRVQSHEGVRWGRDHERRFRKAAMGYLENLGQGSCPGGHDWPCQHTLRAPKSAANVADYFHACAGMDERFAKACADRLLADVTKRVTHTAAAGGTQREEAR